ncbi:succinate dehydrogenase flavin-adding protein (antitoxin of CptAB toxin-antitoxin module) [Chryseobacterium defluvii]|uniref:Succinate dehydrogenase flavin-adding protein (Antitoxin of CptAB toxin-antitoxin module) n=1 Tax=Chryseobacterium defluvii TaxID=160396 RepID=A0A840KG81_9FLAO|nr:DUF3667 domain-containing protein [Chryseobacterium defluvii]MBB4807665.1 succinate dehydrogenase flavin-adding protein (antitoxin of CptAB toxin-antitoxin module) [Chryseobacterium defluvii]
MSHGKIREDKNCLNCGYHVEERFCPNCGQENVERRQPFHYLFTHFIEDFTHYDGQFWKTIKYLLLYPGKLTRQYLVGKRQLYVAPVKLYIFISFITFLLPGFLPKSKNPDPEDKKTRVEKARDGQETTKKVLDDLQKEGILSIETTKNVKNNLDTIQARDSIEYAIRDNGDILDRTFDQNETTIMDAHNMKQYDSLLAKNDNGLYEVMRPIAKKMFELKEEGLSKKQIRKKYAENFVHTIPKALFIYLPIFAFFLWVFHNKKKWWYFDHSIFTLHYFSFLLLSTLIFIIVNRISDFLPDYSVFTLLQMLFSTVLFIYTCVYFFIAHHRVYESSKRVSILKGSLLFIINFIGLTIMLLVLMYLSFVMLH